MGAAHQQHLLLRHVHVAPLVLQRTARAAAHGPHHVVPLVLQRTARS
jgi:hypothetical protein